MIFEIQTVKTPSTSLSSLRLEKRGEWSMLTQQMTSKLASPSSASQPNTKGLESSIWVGMKLSAHQAAPRGPPLCSFPVLFSPITKATPNPPKSLCFWQGTHQPFMASTHQPLPSQGWEHRLSWGRLSHCSISNTKCSVSSAAHNPTPTPTQFLLRVEETWETLISTQEGGTNRNFPAPCFPGSPTRKGREKVLLLLQQPSFKGLISLPPLCPLFYKDGRNEG